jgi:chromosomal replication initiation ATPase DnaA
MKQQSDIVAHSVFGEGVVVATRWDGGEAQVKFRSGLCLWLPSRWLKSIAAHKTELDQISSKRLLEAFRMGVVPHQDIDSFTFGRAYEISALEQGLQELKKGQGDVYLIEGSYGSGKTHLLEYTRHLSLKRGLVTVLRIESSGDAITQAKAGLPRIDLQSALY